MAEKSFNQMLIDTADNLKKSLEEAAKLRNHIFGEEIKISQREYVAILAASQMPDLKNAEMRKAYVQEELIKTGLPQKVADIKLELAQVEADISYYKRVFRIYELQYAHELGITIIHKE